MEHSSNNLMEHSDNNPMEHSGNNPMEHRSTNHMKTGNVALPARWRAAYRSALALLESDQPYSDPLDPVARARVQRLRTDTRRWIREQKALAAAGVLDPVQSFFIAQIPDNWLEIDLRRRHRRRS
jgi:hypothetical protein